MSEPVQPPRASSRSSIGVAAEDRAPLVSISSVVNCSLYLRHDSSLFLLCLQTQGQIVRFDGHQTGALDAIGLLSSTTDR
jgi:hypothetical protein